MLFAAIVAAWFLSPQLLYIEKPATAADVIIILGGDAEGRVWRGSKKEEFRMKTGNAQTLHFILSDFCLLPSALFRFRIRG